MSNACSLTAQYVKTVLNVDLQFNDASTTAQVAKLIAYFKA
jgi:hypothetical protein